MDRTPPPAPSDPSTPSIFSIKRTPVYSPCAHRTRLLCVKNMIAFTFQLDAKRTAIKVTDRKQRARELFLERGQLPSEGGSNPLLDLFNDNYAVEIFYFPASSLEITNVLR